MSLFGQILDAWRHGWGRALRRQIESGAGEERALGWVMVATVLLIAAQSPSTYRNILASGVPAEDLPAAMIMSIVFTLFLGPLTFYGIAALAHIGARLGGAKGPYLNARLALFWALLCVTPLVLITAVLGNLLGPSFDKPLQYFVLLGFLLIWSDTMTTAESLKSRLYTGLALSLIGATLIALVRNLPTV